MLNRWDQGVLAQAFGLGTREIVADAKRVTRWRGPADDLLADLRERRSWSAVATYRYLGTLRRALAGEQPY